MNENLENEEKNLALVPDEDENVRSLSDFRNSKQRTDIGTYTNITDRKELFNLSSKVDFKLNDCENEKIKVKKVLIRTFTKLLRKPIVDEDTGEILKETETSMSVVLVDDNGKSYATGSKTFGYQLINYLVDFDGSKDLENGVTIQIVKNSTPSGNKALGFILV